MGCKYVPEELKRAARKEMGAASESDLKALEGKVNNGGSGSGTASTMTGATEDADGAAGLVPAPKAGEQDKFLRGDGTWTSVIAEVGLTSAQISALDGMFKVTAFSSDPVSAYAAFRAAFGLTDSGDSDGGGDSGDSGTVFTGTNLLADVAFVEVISSQYENGMGYGLVSDRAITLTAGTYYLYSVYKTSSGVYPKLYTDGADGAFTNSTDTIATITHSGIFKTGVFNDGGLEKSSYYQPNNAGYLIEITIILSSDFTGYLHLGASSLCYANTETGWTMLTTEQFNPFKQTLS